MFHLHERRLRMPKEVEEELKRAADKLARKGESKDQKRDGIAKAKEHFILGKMKAEKREWR